MLKINMLRDEIFSIFKRVPYSIIAPHKFFKKKIEIGNISYITLFLIAFVLGSVYIILQFFSISHGNPFTALSNEMVLYFILDGGVLMTAQWILAMLAFVVIYLFLHNKDLPLKDIALISFYLPTSLWVVGLVFDIPNLFFDLFFPLSNIHHIIDGPVSFPFRFSHFFTFPWIIVALSMIFIYQIKLNKIMGPLLAIFLVVFARFFVEHPNVIWVHLLERVFGERVSGIPPMAIYLFTHLFLLITSFLSLLVITKLNVAPKTKKILIVFLIFISVLLAVSFENAF